MTSALRRHAGCVRVLFVLALVLGATGCGGGDDGEWNVLLVTLDTTRADHLGAWAYEHVDTPTLDALASESVRWDRCYATAPITLPSHASILTGLYPMRHGLHFNGTDRLPDEALTLAELLTEQGYDTGAVVSAFVLDEKFGLGQGFGDYDDDLSLAAARSRYSYATRNAALVTDAAVAWLKRFRRQPFFLWVHYFDPHAPYEAPGHDASDRTRVPFRTPYDAEIEYVDGQLARLFGALVESGQDQKTLVIVTGDHGEALWDHGEATHGLFAYEGTLRVPLLVRFPDRRAGASSVAQPVSVVDLMPSILGWLGHTPPEGLDGRPLPMPDAEAEQTEFRSIIFENNSPAQLYGWSPQWGMVVGNQKFIRAPRPELYDLVADPNEQHNLIAHDAALAAEWLDDFEAVMGALAARPRLNRVGVKLAPTERVQLEALGYTAESEGPPQLLEWRDPRGADAKDRVELQQRILFATSLIDQNRALEATHALATILREDDPGNRRALTILVDLALREETRPGAIDGLLAALGHLTGDVAFDAAVRFRLALALIEEQRLAEALVTLRRVVEIAPDFMMAHWHLARALEKAGGDASEISPHLERVVALSPDSIDAHYQLAVLYQEQGELARAEEALRRALVEREGETPPWRDDARVRLDALQAGR